MFKELRVRDATITGIYTDGFAVLHASSLTELVAAEEQRREAKRDVPEALAASWETETAMLASVGSATWKNPGPQQGQGSNYTTLVELRGFEPLTPSMRTRCATGLRYSPKERLSA